MVEPPLPYPSPEDRERIESLLAEILARDDGEHAEAHWVR